MTEPGYIIFESGDEFAGTFLGGEEKAGEVVFNTSHSGYEEMSSDPSYFSQIIVTTAPMQGNYGQSRDIWESQKLWIHGFVCVEMQDSARDSSWKDQLLQNNIPILTEVDTRQLVLTLREKGTVWGAIVKGDSIDEAREKAKQLISEAKTQDLDWVHKTSRNDIEDIQGDNPRGPKVAVLDLGSKKNILRELKKRCSQIRVFPSRTPARDIKEWQPQGIMLTNGPGDPQDVQVAIDTVRDLIGFRFIFGICMGHQILCLALGGETYKLKFGHRGSNHPVEDKLLKRIYVTSQNHGYAVRLNTLPSGLQVTHTNLNDGTVSGIYFPDRKCLSVQFHPESHPGPHDAEGLFDYFIKQIQ